MHRSVAAHAQIVRSSLALALFVLALLLGAIWPIFAPYPGSRVSRLVYRPGLARRFYDA